MLVEIRRTYVGLHGVQVVLNALRCQPFERHTVVARLAIVLQIAGVPRETEVGHFHSQVRGDQHIASGQIAVDAMISCQVLHAVGYLKSERNEILRSEPLLGERQAAIVRPVLAEKIFQIAALGVLHDHVERSCLVGSERERGRNIIRTIIWANKVWR